jgi:hypothetical protein
VQVQQVSAAVFEDGVGAAVVHLDRLGDKHGALGLEFLVGAPAVVGGEGDGRRTGGAPSGLEGGGGVVRRGEEQFGFVTVFG